MVIMKKKYLILIALAIFAAILGKFAYDSNAIAPKKPLLIFPLGSTYEKEWIKVDSLKNKGLNRFILVLLSKPILSSEYYLQIYYEDG